DRLVQEPVHQDRGGQDAVTGVGAGGAGDVVDQLVGVVHDLHAAAAEHIGGPHQYRVPDPGSDTAGLVQRLRRAELGGVQARLQQHLAEMPTVLGRIDRLRGRPPDRQAGRFEALGQPERGLPAQLDDHPGHLAYGTLGLIDLQDVLERQRFEVEAVGGVVVGGDGLRVAVDHHRLVAVLQPQGGVHAGVVELDALADAVRPGADDQDGGALTRADLGLGIVAGVVVGRACREFGGAGVHGLVHRAQPIGVPQLAYRVLLQPPDVGDLLIGEPVTFGADEDAFGQRRGLPDLLGDLGQQVELVGVPRVEPRRRVEVLRFGPAADGLHHLVQTAVRGGAYLLQQCGRGLGIGYGK